MTRAPSDPTGLQPLSNQRPKMLTRRAAETFHRHVGFIQTATDQDRTPSVSKSQQKNPAAQESEPGLHCREPEGSIGETPN